MLDLKIQNQISPTCLLVLKKHECNSCQQKNKKKIAQEGIQEKGLGNQNEEHFINLFESNILKTQFIFPIVNYPELHFLLKIQTT